MHYKSNSPVALFVYNRVDNTRQTIAHLMANTLAPETDLYVFSDGGKSPETWAAVNVVRDYLHEVKAEVERTGALRSVTLVERAENYYLERNIIEGISYVFEHHDRIIVLEDDICTSPYFLQFMNDAFATYLDTPHVMHIGGFTNLRLDLHTDIQQSRVRPTGTYFTPHMAGWGWGTWRDRWQTHFRHYQTREEALYGLSPEDIDAMQYGGVFPCLNSLDRNPIPWDVCWEIAIYRAGGLCLYPIHSLVRNIGLRQGTHFSSSPLIQRYAFDRPPYQHPIRVEKVDVPASEQILEEAFAYEMRDWGIRYTPLGKMLRAIYRLIHARHTLVLF